MLRTSATPAAMLDPPQSGGVESSVCAGLEDQFRLAGLLGSIIYSVLLSVTLWRSILLFRGNSAESTLFAHKKLFHGFLCLSFVLELPFYLGLAESHCYSKPSYASHLLALWADLCAFSMVIILWSKALALVKVSGLAGFDGAGGVPLMTKLCCCCCLQDKDLLYTWVVALDCFALLYTLVVISLVIISRDFNDFLTGWVALRRATPHASCLSFCTISSL